MNFYERQIEAALKCVAVESLRRFTWFDAVEGGLPPRIVRAMDPALLEVYFVSRLQSRLYDSFYCCGGPQPAGEQQETSGVDASPALLAELSAANAGRGAFSAGWTVVGFSGDELIVERSGVSLRAPRSECAVDSGEFRPGAAVLVRMPREQFGVSPGYHMLLGDHELPWRRPEPLVRIYWNITPEAAPCLAQELTTRLNKHGVAYRFKVLNHPRKFWRCDSAVLYLRRADFESARPHLSAARHRLAPHLRSRTPVFTKRLAPGVGFAEEPLAGGSFGWHRCRLMAEGVARGFRRKACDATQRLSLVVERFAEEDVDLERPYLNAGSDDVGEPFSCCWPSLSQAPRRRSEQFDRQSVSESAYGIADKLHRAAYRSGRRCTWLARSLSPGGGGETCASRGADLYDGLSGIGWFLAEAALRSGERRWKETACGAMHQALACADDIPPAQRLGLYCGWLGIAVCAARVGRLLDDPGLLTGAEKLAARLPRQIDGLPHFDLISGLAGGVLGLLHLGQQLETPLCLQLARRCGDELVARAEPTLQGACWRSWIAPQRPALLGYSHGAAGVAHALAELFAKTGERKYEQTARDALRYERHWYNPAARNWPDLRIATAAGSKRKLSYMCAWCHGAAGIALSRLRTARILADEVSRREAEAALETTAASVRSSLSEGDSQLSLCHGLAGNADVLLTAYSKVAAKKTGSSFKLAADAAQAIAEHLRSDRRSTAEQILSGPGLMTGMSGPAFFLLRTVSRDLPSPLLFGLNTTPAAAQAEPAPAPSAA